MAANDVSSQVDLVSNVEVVVLVGTSEAGALSDVHGVVLPVAAQNVQGVSVYSLDRTIQTLEVAGLVTREVVSQPRGEEAERVCLFVGGGSVVHISVDGDGGGLAGVS